MLLRKKGDVNVAKCQTGDLCSHNKENLSYLAQKSMTFH